MALVTVDEHIKTDIQIIAEGILAELESIKNDEVLEKRLSTDEEWVHYANELEKKDIASLLNEYQSYSNLVQEGIEKARHNCQYLLGQEERWNNERPSLSTAYGGLHEAQRSLKRVRHACYAWEGLRHRVLDEDSDEQ